jgi:hypothetical protein
MGKGFPVEKIPAEAHPTVLMFATGGSGLLNTYFADAPCSSSLWACAHQHPTNHALSSTASLDVWSAAKPQLEPGISRIFLPGLTSRGGSSPTHMLRIMGILGVPRIPTSPARH